MVAKEDNKNKQSKSKVASFAFYASIGKTPARILRATHADTLPHPLCPLLSYSHCRLRERKKTTHHEREREMVI